MTLFVVNVALDDRGRRDEFVREALARHLAARGLDDRPGTPRRGRNFSSTACLWVTVQVVFAVVLLALLIGVPAAYTLARRDFPGKRLLMLLFLLPLMVPPITYGIPLATVLYKVQLAGTIYGVILANLIPAAPFVILVMTPFIEQIDPNLESAARVFGAGTGAHVLARPGAAARRPASSRPRCWCWCARSRCSSSPS